MNEGKLKTKTPVPLPQIYLLPAQIMWSRTYLFVTIFSVITALQSLFLCYDQFSVFCSLYLYMSHVSVKLGLSYLVTGDNWYKSKSDHDLVLRLIFMHCGI